ncbi:unnamed protein product [Callosobruchus maculatus]|uniref:Uncharacterized protein n=1 Tax=Callosobruchus maculatus TaxID=64391 RepID=A0A653CLZ0_CALMS|nr:unnamed protein product [Callosobruchus maculatus]
MLVLIVVGQPVYLYNIFLYIFEIANRVKPCSHKRNVDLLMTALFCFIDIKTFERQTC